MRHRTPTVHMLFGFVGSGKSTLARTLESELGAVRFSSNEWLVALYGTNPPAELFDEYHQRIARWMEVQYSRVLAVGIDIILETAVKADENDVDVQKQAGF